VFPFVISNITAGMSRRLGREGGGGEGKSTSLARRLDLGSESVSMPFVGGYFIIYCQSVRSRWGMEGMRGEGKKRASQWPAGG